MAKCCMCGVELPNKWAVAKRETSGGVERCYCHLHASGGQNGNLSTKGEKMDESKNSEASAKERETGEEAGEKHEEGGHSFTERTRRTTATAPTTAFTNHAPERGDRTPVSPRTRPIRRSI